MSSKLDYPKRHRSLFRAAPVPIRPLEQERKTKPAPPPKTKAKRR